MKEQIKPELNNESKARFFAQHAGQKVFFTSHLQDKPHINNWGSKLINKSDFLLLTNLSDITDEEAIKVAKLMYPKDNHNDKDCLIWGKEIVVEILQGQTDKDVVWFAGILPVIDYLRSKGYALPWMGLSVEDLVNAGWVKLKGVNNNG